MEGSTEGALRPPDVHLRIDPIALVFDLFIAVHDCVPFHFSPCHTCSMNSESDQIDHAKQIATRAYDKGARRDGGSHLQDWLDAEEEIRRLQILTRRVAEVEARAEVAKETDLSRQLAETESRLRSLLAERKQAERRLIAEHAVARFLSESSEFSECGPRILRAICEALEWDVGVFWMLDRAANVLRCVEVWHVPAVEVGAFAQASRDLAFATGVGLPGRIWASGSPVWIPVVTQDSTFLRAASAAHNGLHGGIGFPIHDGVEFLGVMEFFSREVRQPGQELLTMMSVIGGQISQSIQRRRAETRLRREDEQRLVARQIQEGLLPNSAPLLTGFTIGARSWPCYDVGGDYFDAFLMSDGSLALVIGDASGHAIGPALVIAETRAYIRAFAMTSTDPSSILALTNQRLCEDLASRHFVTLFFGRLDPCTGSLSYAGAGHCPGYVLSPEGHIKATLTSKGMPLGVNSASDYPLGPAARLSAGDLLFLYTDGVVEAGSAGSVEQFGIERTLTILRAHRTETPDQILDAIYRAARDFSPLCDQGDDITAILVKAEAGNPARVALSAGMV
jgi:serine phosphatase RsbU (regulator of sigma subunit)